MSTIERTFNASEAKQATLLTGVASETITSMVGDLNFYAGYGDADGVLVSMKYLPEGEYRWELDPNNEDDYYTGMVLRGCNSYSYKTEVYPDGSIGDTYTAENDYYSILIRYYSSDYGSTLNIDCTSKRDGSVETHRFASEGQEPLAPVS